MKIVIVGATRGIGRALARACAKDGHSLFLLGRSDQELQKSASDLSQRSGGSRPVGYASCDLEDPSGFASALQAADQALGHFDTVIVTAALFASQEALEQDRDLCRRLLTVNFAHTVVFCEEAKTMLLARGGGTLCALSSVAGDRGRKPIALYGASKAGLSAYLEALDHKHRAEGLVTLCVKPGFVKTGMTEGLPAPPFAGEPDQVAADILRALKKKKPLLYTPFMWRWVMLVIRNLPRFVMRKIKF